MAGDAFLRLWRAAALGLCVLGGLLGTGAARADVWGYVDDNGMTHFASSKLDARYQLYFKSEHFEVDPRQVAAAQAAQQRLPATPTLLPASSGLVFNPAADAAAGTKARRLVAAIDQSSAYRRARAHIQREAARNRLDADLLKSIIAAESGFNPGAVSGAGAVGLMQVMPDTARDMGLRADERFTVEQKLTDPSLNVRLGARYLKFLVNKFPGRLDLAVAAYNAGHGAVSRAGNMVPRYAETQAYVRTVLALYQTMKPGALAALPGAGPIPLARARGGRVRMTIAAGKAARTPAPPQPAAQIAMPSGLADVPRADETGIQSTQPSAMDAVADKLAQAEAAVRLGKDVIVKPSGSPAPSTGNPVLQVR